MRRALAAVAVTALGITLGVLVGVLRGGGEQPPAAQAAPPPLTVTTHLPEWRAPDVPVQISGFARALAQVQLRANGELVGSSRSGRLGAYRLTFRPHVPGRYRLSVGDGVRLRPVGTLVVRAVTLEAVGDITFGEQVGPAIAAHGPGYPWTAIAPTLRRADVTVGNLETSVSTRGTAAAKEFTFRGAPSALPPLARLAGFDVLTLANNHAVDYRRDALLDTVRYVRAAGMQPIGAGANDRQARRPAIVDRGGLKIAFLGYSDVNPAGFTATATEAGTARADTAAIAADVRAARRRADVVVCFCLWGVDPHPDPDARQETFAAACLNAGAQLVLGAHPHVLGPISRPSASTLVAWSLGNFMFPSSAATAKTAILRVSLGRDGVRDYGLVPVRIDGFRPRLAR
jgi:poly-gamma-glutamate capsule biosynthesis protein CapA/YwtB (metallophosphatase superfamily)